MGQSAISVTNQRTPCKPLLQPMQFLLSLAGSMGLGLAAALPAAAETLFFTYGPFLKSLSTESLETFVEEGTVEGDLAFFFDVTGADEAEQAAYREALARTVEVDEVAISRFLYSNVGEEILNRLGELIQTRAGLNGQRSLRAALINASLDEEGLSLLNFLEHLPTDLQIDVNQTLELERTVNRLVDVTDESIATLRRLSAEEALQEPHHNYASLENLTQWGAQGFESRRLTLTDPGRRRTFYVDLYQPQRLLTGQTHVVIYSHGLSSSPEARKSWGEFLATHGFVVAMPQHPGSDAQQMRDLLEGRSSEVFLVNEFVDRPQDISFVIDELERRNAAEFGGRLNLSNVGVSGHSFGGYTALAVAGATIDFDHLTTDCNRQFGHLNLSLILQCEALKLPRQEYDFRDERVGAVLVANPVNSSIFGPDGLGQITIPVAVMAGSLDPATPAVFEQFQTFPWLHATNKYLALLEGQAHVDLSELDAGISQLLQSIPTFELASADVISRYAQAIGLAFFERFISRRPQYRLFLRATYADYLSQDEEFKLYLISEESDEEVVEPLEREPLLPDASRPEPNLIEMR